MGQQSKPQYNREALPSLPHKALSVRDSAMDDAQVETLIPRALGEDQRAFAELYTITVGSVYRLAYSILLDRQDAEDVVQETYLYAFRNLSRFDRGRGSFRTWLYTIAVSRCRNARRRKWLPTVDLFQLLSKGAEPREAEENAPDFKAAMNGTVEALARALETLSPRLREAVALRYGQGLTYRAMAEILGVPAKTAESRIRLAHESIRTAMSSADLDLLAEVYTLI